MAALPPIDHSLDGESRFSEIVGILSFCSVLSTTAVALRVYTRWRLIDAFGADDGTMVVAQVCRHRICEIVEKVRQLTSVKSVFHPSCGCNDWD